MVSTPLRSSPPSDRVRPSLRDLARLAGVSVMSVSRALRNDPKVSPDTKSTVTRLAEQIGYRPDPEVSRLMNHLRSRRKRMFQGLMVALTDRASSANSCNVDRMAQAAQRRAESQGHAFNTFVIEAASKTQLQRIFQTRGVQGILLLPLAEPRDLTTLLDWSHFSVVSVTSSILAPSVCRVVPDHYSNMLTLCRKLRERGSARIGLVIDSFQNRPVNHAFAAAVTWHNTFCGASDLPPLALETFDEAAVRAWFVRNRPDAIVAGDAAMRDRIRRALGLPPGTPVLLTCAYTKPEADFGGIDELPEDIATTGVDLLSQAIRHRERGLPAIPTTTSLPGRWREAASSLAARS